MIQFKHASRILAPVLVALCGLSATSAMAADLQPSQVPAHVRAVVEKMYPKAAFIEWEFDKEVKAKIADQKAKEKAEKLAKKGK